jgi:hypothetical protein
MRLLLPILFLAALGWSTMDAEQPDKTGLLEGAPQPTLEVRSTAFLPNALIPARYGCDGEDVSPTLRWQTPPEGTESLAIIVSDPDTPNRRVFYHWIVYNLPPRTRQLLEAVPRQDMLTDGSRQGVNSARKTGYMGPCPPPLSKHRYYFTLYALDKKLVLPPGAGIDLVETAMQGHILATGQLMGRFER